MITRPGPASGWQTIGGADPEVSATSVPFDLSGATLQQLRHWSTSLYKQLDDDFPSYGILDDYARVTAEIGGREQGPRAPEVPERTPVGQRLTVRDNDLKRHFELFIDGTLAAYLVYTTHTREIRLHRTMLAEAFEATGLEKALISRVLLLTHKRRLATIVECPAVQRFLTEHPQYRQILHSP